MGPACRRRRTAACPACQRGPHQTPRPPAGPSWSPAAAACTTGARARPFEACAAGLSRAACQQPQAASSSGATCRDVWVPRTGLCAGTYAAGSAQPQGLAAAPSAAALQDHGHPGHQAAQRKLKAGPGPWLACRFCASAAVRPTLQLHRRERLFTGRRASEPTLSSRSCSLSGRCVRGVRQASAQAGRSGPNFDQSPAKRVRPCVLSGRQLLQLPAGSCCAS